MLPISPSQLNADIASVIGTCIVLKILPSPSIIRRERTPFIRALQTASFQTLGLFEHRIPQNLMIDHHFPNHISIFRINRSPRPPPQWNLRFSPFKKPWGASPPFSDNSCCWLGYTSHHIPLWFIMYIPLYPSYISHCIHTRCIHL